MEAFLSLLSDVSRSGSANGTEETSEIDVAAVVDTNICCFATGKLYTEGLLGVGVSRARNNVTTAAELLSKEAYDGGLRQSTNKAAFEFFLPVWINENHSMHRAEWCETLSKSCSEIGSKVFQVSDEDKAHLEVLPRLINQMIVEMMRPDADKSEAIAIFEAMSNFWRTLRWLVDTKASVRNQVRETLAAFTSCETQRHKDRTPDLGVVLVLFTVFQGHEGCPSRLNFIDAYLDENSLRWVMWWQRAGVRAEPTPVFQETKVSRDICMFQMMVLDIVVADVKHTLQEMEATNCKLPDRLEQLQKEWRERKVSTDTWGKYFEHIGASRPTFNCTGEWIQDCVRRASDKGPKYGGAKSQGKGSNGGHNRKGKGGGRGK
jgi:hypothetical protein